MKGMRVKIIVYGIVSAVLFCVLLLGTFPLRKSRKEYAPQIVALGDSILGQVRDETSVTKQLSGLLGREVFNGALGGTCASRVNTEGRLTYSKDSLSFAMISRGAALDDYGWQQATRIRESATEHFAEVIDDLEKIDFSGVDILLVQYGLNDYHAGVPLDNPDDPYDPYTFAGAFRSGISAWREAYPDIRIILLTSTYSWYEYAGETCEERNEGGGILEDYINTEIQVAEEMNVEILDLYHDFYPHETWEDLKLYTRDGLHPNEAGRKLLAETIAEYLSQSTTPSAVRHNASLRHGHQS